VQKSNLVLSPYYPPPGSVASGSVAGSVFNSISATASNVITAGHVPVSVFGPYSSVNTGLILQHSGYYYLIAAKCGMERMARFGAEEKGGIVSPPPVAAGMFMHKPPLGLDGTLSLFNCGSFFFGEL
jgi:hypothetical protein